MRLINPKIWPVFLMAGLVFTGVPFQSTGASLQKATAKAPIARTNSVPGREWAVKLSKPGLNNLHIVTTNLYRGAQPTAAGMRTLEAMGIKTVINLRANHTDKDLIVSTRLQQERIPFTTWRPKDEDVIRFLRLVTDPERAPIFVHCQHGSDRTGTMLAIYRIAIQGWSKEEAIQEMTRGGFGFHSIWTNLIKYVKKLNIEDLKKRAFEKS